MDEKIGEWGEIQAAKWLARRYQMHLWYKNWRCRVGEIDLVMIAGQIVTLVEVKTRRIDLLDSYSVEDAIDDNKSSKLKELKVYFEYSHRRTLQRLHLKKVELSAVLIYYKLARFGLKTIVTKELVGI